jgi:hypothetical protein
MILEKKVSQPSKLISQAPAKSHPKKLVFVFYKMKVNRKLCKPFGKNVFSDRMGPFLSRTNSYL